MRNNRTTFFAIVAVMGLMITAVTGTAQVLDSDLFAHGHDRDLCYEVTVTNMTHAQVFTPVLVVTHKKGVKLFTPGEPATDELAQLAEGGDVAPLADLLDSMGNRVGAIAVSEGGPFGAGESRKILVPASHRYNRLSLASMLAVTNDGFIALNGVHTRFGMLTSPVYDAGTEINDELAANIPGPGGEGYNPADGEGFVHIHRGIHGIGDLVESRMDWRNPAARITSHLVKCEFD